MAQKHGSTFDVFRKGEELFVTPNFPGEDGSSGRPFFYALSQPPFAITMVYRVNWPLLTVNNFFQDFW
ncbi:MAG TPA: hypothetical protein DIU00_03895 [Phycisphaerales bacterium]|nr:hypothetical protein [Phycisphaerales bacterium]